MSALLFKLRHVPEDEAEAVRTLLNTNNIEWYETNAGNWGISMPGIWSNNEHQVADAIALIEQYQQERTIAQRSEYEKQKQLGQQVTLTQRLLQHPLQSAAIVIFCAFVLFVSIHPFLQMIGYSQQ